MLATNTIAQGDTREIGLEQLLDSTFTIFRAISSRKWPGAANLDVAYLWVRNGIWKNYYNLDDKCVSNITSLLTEPGRVTGKPFRLFCNEGKAFIGTKLYGLGFVLESEKASHLINQNPLNKKVLFPYLNGEDVNSKYDQSPSRWVINFFDWPLNANNLKEPQKNSPCAIDFPDCLSIISQKVKPEREKNNRKERKERWWQYGERCPGLYAAIAKLEKILVIPRVSKYAQFCFVSPGSIYSEALTVIADSSNSIFALLNCTFHSEWAFENGSSLGMTLRYTPSDIFVTNPFPENYSALDKIGKHYDIHRQSIMVTRQEGLTDTYNRFHNPNEASSDITKLRQLHKEMDEAVAEAYGWMDLDLGHGFHQTKQGMRYTICEEARREVLDRLLELNHQRYAEEVAAGLHDTGKGKKKGASASSKGKKAKAEETEEAQGSLF